jgi:hypothetical protein
MQAYIPVSEVVPYAKARIAELPEKMNAEIERKLAAMMEETTVVGSLWWAQEINVYLSEQGALEAMKTPDSRFAFPSDYQSIVDRYKIYERRLMVYIALEEKVGDIYIQLDESDISRLKLNVIEESIIVED